MAFLNDLDGFVWAAAIVAIVVCCLVTLVDFQDWLDHRRIDVADGRTTLVAVCAIAFLAGAFSSYSPNANAPRKTVEGVARFVGESHSRNGYKKYICATSCQQTGGYALALHDEATGVVHIGSSYAFTYLEHPVGNAFTGVSLRVIEVSVPDTGRVLYTLDLTNHPWRIVVYLLEAALVVGAGLLGGLLNRSKRMQSAEAHSEESEEEGEPKGDGPISLGLESKDGD